MRINSLFLLVTSVAAQGTFSGKTLRIMPMGDSITEGSCSTGNNGYRKPLMDLLNGNQVDFIGSYVFGNMRDNQFEGHSGYYIDQIQRGVLNSAGSRPNIILLHAGTNNLNSLSTTGPLCAAAGSGDSNDPCQKAMNELDGLLRILKYTDALIVIAKLIPTTQAAYNQRIGEYNKLIANWVFLRNAENAGWKLQIADMQGSDGIDSSYIDPTCGGTQASGNIAHPNDAGYSRMANVWYKAISYGFQANQVGNLLLPIKAALRKCDNPTQQPGAACGAVSTFPSRGKSNRLAGVQCSGTGSMCNCQDSGSSSNFTVPKTLSCAEMSVVYTSAVRWVDITGDGRQENVFIQPDGKLDISVNKGQTSSSWSGDCNTIASTWRNLATKTISTSSTVPKQYQIQLADLNGDGRAEYIVVAPNGDATGYFNTGSKTTNYDNVDVTFSSTAETVGSFFGVPGVGVRFVDFNGDGRADYVWVGANGDLRVWLNNGANQNTAAVSNWQDQGTITPQILAGTLRENVIIADVNSDGRADYLIVTRQNGAVGAWINNPPTDGTTKPAWAWTTIATQDQGTSVQAGNFGNIVDFGDPDGDGRLDYLVTDFGTSSSKGIKNQCNQHDYGPIPPS